MSVRPFPFRRRPSASYSVASTMVVGEILTWHSTTEDGVPDAPMFSVQRLSNGWRLNDDDGQLIGCFASLDAASDVGFLHVEKTEGAQ